MRSFSNLRKTIRQVKLLYLSWHMGLDYFSGFQLKLKMFDSQSDSYFNSETESRSYLNFNASELYWSFLFNYFKELIIFALFFIVMAAIWLRTIPCFLVINRNLKAEWEKIYSFFRDNIHLNQNFQLPEFAITNHAHYVIKNYFVKVMVGSVVFALFVLYLYFRFPHFYIFEFLLL